jgi:cytochrome c-type biogenesis protein CcmH
VTLFIFLAVALAAVAVLMLAWPFLKPRPEADGKAPARSMSAAATLAVAVPAAAFVLYFTLSDWPWDAQVQAHGADASASLTQMASQLEARLQREQGDADGWKLLGRTYVLMGDFPKAASAYGQANTLSGGADVEALLGLAEARVLVNETEFEGEAGRMFERALQLAPNEPKALWYGGLVSYRVQDLATARQRWSALRDLAPPPELLQVIDARLAEIDATIGVSTPAALPVASAPVAAPTAPSEAPAAAAVADVGEGIPLRITIAPELAARVPPGATLFVLARSGAGGPPLAAVRRSSSELPLTMRLSDAEAMIPGTSLAQVDDLDIVARVSLTGRPVSSKGDLYGQVRYDPAAKGPLSVTIDRVAD